MFSLVQSSSFRVDKTGLFRTAAAIQRLHLDESPHQTHHRHHRYQLLLQRVQPSPLVLGVVQLPRLLDLALQLDGALLEALQDQQEVLVVQLAQVARAQVFNPPIQSLWTTMEKCQKSIQQFSKEPFEVELTFRRSANWRSARLATSPLGFRLLLCIIGPGDISWGITYTKKTLGNSASCCPGEVNQVSYNWNKTIALVTTDDAPNIAV